MKKVHNKRNVIKNIVLFFIIFLGIGTKNIDAKYAFNINEEVICLTRDTRVANYVINYSIKDEYTNQDVKVVITFDKEIESLDGFVKIDDYTFEKIYTENILENVKFVDYSGNKSYLPIEISNIDKELPQILNLSDNLIVPLKLDYLDNVGIKSIEVKRYSGDLNFRALDDFYDDKRFYGVDVTDTEINAQIIGRPVGTKKYKYYLNGILKSITNNTSFLFTNLEPLTNYTIKVEAIDENGNVILSREKNAFTQCFKQVIEYKTDSLGVMTIEGIYPIVSTIKVAVWSDENTSDVTWVDLNYKVSDGKITFVFNRETFKYTNSDYIYRIHFYFYDENGNKLLVFPYNLQFGVSAKEFVLDVEDVYNITVAGTYQIIVEDLAGNKLEKYIEVN